MLVSVNKLHQSKVNKAVKYLVKYNNLNNLRDNADSNGDEKEYNKLNRQCEIVFDNYLEIVYELPKRERDRIEKSELY
tara:strand:- start:788 stop:1021 length:234 start_codon:yes stop_codon:yes gene_type:complete